MSEKTSCGFISVLGLPNAGKSTLINALVGAKVSIVSSKVQTTRSRILGIVMHDRAQIILIDTPGIFEPKKTLEKAMVTAAWDSVPDADFIYHLIDASDKKAVQKNALITDRLQGEKNCILVLNKTDAVAKPDLLRLAQALNEKVPYLATFMVSALKGDGLQDLLKDAASRLPAGPWMYPEDQITDMPMRMLAAEITREKLFEALYQELPYALMVETESWEEFDDGSVKISQVIVVQKDSQKAIVVGKGGANIKKVGQEARLELEDIMERRVHLKLFAKVIENWAESAESYRTMGLDLPK